MFYCVMLYFPWYVQWYDNRISFMTTSSVECPFFYFFSGMHIFSVVCPYFQWYAHISVECPLFSCMTIFSVVCPYFSGIPGSLARSCIVATDRLARISGCTLYMACLLQNLVGTWIWGRIKPKVAGL